MDLSPDQRIAGVLAPSFALRSDEDLGIGDTLAVRQLVDWAAATGFRLVQLLPINETGSDNSPYNAVSSVAIDPTTIHVSPRSIPELTEEDFAEITARFHVQDLREGAVNYPQVKALKRALLVRAFERFSVPEKKTSSRTRQFRSFVRENKEWLPGYAMFRTLMDQNGTEQWDKWPAEQQTGKAAAKWLKKLPTAERRVIEQQGRFHEFVQWVAFTQWRELHAYADAKRVALMGDVPIGISYYSSDVFSEPENFDLEWSGGAPPEKVFKSDPFTEKWGQNWGVPLYDWEHSRTTQYRWWLQRVRMVREIFHLFRIDHILGFYRIYSFPWRPQQNEEFLPLSEAEAKERTGGRLPGFLPHDDETPEHRELNQAHGEEPLKVLVEEVGEHRLIGEDLGVVPDYVRPSLAKMGIAGFKIPMWENRDGGLIPGENYQRLSVTTYATHDHPPLKVQWDELVKRAFSSESGERDHAMWELRSLAAFAGLEGELPQPYSEKVWEAMIRGLFSSNAWLAIYMITDVFGSTQRFNVPGAVAESNWSERLPLPVLQWPAEEALAARMAVVREVIRETGRGQLAVPVASPRTIT